MYGDQFKPVAYLAHKPSNAKLRGNEWGEVIYEDRYFTAESLAGAMDILKLRHEELPGGPKKRV